MTPTEEKKDKTLQWIPLLFLSLIIGGGFVIWYVHNEFVHSLSHAAIIAGILGLTVDQYAKRHLVREAARDIDRYLLGYALPSELQEKIREIRDAKLVRREFVCRYTILPIDGEPKIRLETDLTFEMVNLTNRRQDYTAELALETHCSPEIVLMSCESHYDRAQEYSLEGSALRPTQNAPKVQATAKTVRLQPSSERTYFNYKFHHRYFQTLPEIGSEYFQFDQAYPTIGARIIVNLPEQFDINFPSEPEIVKSDRAEWSDRKVFLRGEIVTIWWRPKNH